MKQGWEIKSLGEIADIEYGFTDKSTEEGDYRYVRITDIDDNGELISTEKKYLKHSKEAASFLLQDNDLLMARTGATFAKVLLYEDVEPSVFASYLIRIKFKEKIDNKLYWYFSKTKSYWDQANSLASGAAQPHFNGAALKQVIFSYPKSLPEQQSIVSILDEAFAAIAKAKANAVQNLKNAKELFESYLQGVFENGNWETKTIQEITKVVNGYAFASKDFKPTNTIKSVKITNVGVKEFVEEADNYLPEKFKETLKDFQVREGNIVIALTRTIISAGLKVAVVPASYDGALVNQRVAALVPNEKLANQNFLYYFLTTSGVVKYVLAHVNTLMQPNLSINDLKNLPVPCPPIKEQQTIVRQLDALRAKTQRLEAIYQQKLLNLEELKKGVLQKAFNGEI